MRSAHNDSMKPQSCDYCLKPESRGETFLTAEDRERFIIAEQESLGCLDSKPSRIPYRFADGYEMSTCPQKIINEGRLKEYARAYHWLEKHGRLPWGDDLSEQSERFVQAMEIIGSTLKSVEREANERAAKKAPQPSQGYAKGRSKKPWLKKSN